MRKFLKAVALVAVLASPSHAQSNDIEATIANQFEAFRAGDVEKAFSFAAPFLKDMFGNPQQFGLMVRRGYPMVWEPGDVRFLELREVGAASFQKVMITSADGSIHFLEYRMDMGENGWVISGVQILDAPDVSA